MKVQPYPYPWTSRTLLTLLVWPRGAGGEGGAVGETMSANVPFP